MVTRLGYSLAVILALAGCASGADEEGRRFSGAYGGISGGVALGGR